MFGSEMHLKGKGSTYSTAERRVSEMILVRDGHGLGPSMRWVGLNEKYCGIVAEYCRPKTHTFHCP